MKGFPDESQMERSEDGSEPIRGGSIGFNRVLNYFVEAAAVDKKPQFNAVVISAFTIYRNIIGTQAFTTISDLEHRFVAELNLFLDYYDTYLSLVWNRMGDDKFCPVVVYFPDYHKVPKEIARERTGKAQLLLDHWNIFLGRHGRDEGEVKRLDHSRCVWIKAGDHTYPHKDVVRKFRSIAAGKNVLYTTGDPLCLISHVPLDLHMASQLRGIQVLESYTGRVKKPTEFRFKLDKEGRVPFQSAVHVALGDDTLLKPLVTGKVRRELLETAEKERWVSRSEGDVRQRIATISGIPVQTLAKYDFV